MGAGFLFRKEGHRAASTSVQYRTRGGGARRAHAPLCHVPPPLGASPVAVGTRTLLAGGILRFRTGPSLRRRRHRAGIHCCRNADQVFGIHRLRRVPGCCGAAARRGGPLRAVRAVQLPHVACGGWRSEGGGGGGGHRGRSDVAATACGAQLLRHGTRLKAGRTAPQVVITLCTTRHAGTQPSQPAHSQWYRKSSLHGGQAGAGGTRRRG